MQSKAHMEKPQQNSICVSRVSTRNFYLYCISLYGALLNDQQHMQNWAPIQNLHEKIWTSCSTSVFLFFLTFPTRARGVGRCWSHFWVQLTLNYSMTIPTRARADSRNPFCMFFGNTKNDFFKIAHDKFLFVLYFFIWSTLKWTTESMQSKAHIEKPQQNSICISRVSTRNFYLYCIS